MSYSFRDSKCFASLNLETQSVLAYSKSFALFF